MDNQFHDLKKLHLGCGPITPSGWINLDGSWNAWVSKHSQLRGILKTFHLAPAKAFDAVWSSNVLVHDVRKGLPFEANSLSAIYASHMLEHLYLADAKRLLAECYRVLEPNGVLRIVVPDLRALVMEYLDALTDKSSIQSSRVEAGYPADVLNEKMLFRDIEAPRGSLAFRLYTALQDFHSHKWMYDSNSLIGHITEAGFEAVESKQFLQSQIIDIEQVEMADRVLNGAGICVEGIKSVLLT